MVGVVVGVSGWWLSVMVIFATLCDAPDCGARSEEYTSWPSCRVCHSATCPAHAIPGSTKEREYDRDGVAECVPSVICMFCAEDGALKVTASVLDRALASSTENYLPPAA